MNFLCFSNTFLCMNFGKLHKLKLNEFVNTNSKYKEDDFTDSDGDDYFQDM